MDFTPPMRWRRWRCLSCGASVLSRDMQEHIDAHQNEEGWVGVVELTRDRDAEQTDERVARDLDLLRRWRDHEPLTDDERERVLDLRDKWDW